MSSSASKCFLFAASSAMFAACETGKGTAQFYHVTLGIVPKWRRVWRLGSTGSTKPESGGVGMG